ncbi:MAG TPA: PIN domain-containing protein [Anaerolineae bacterium]|nr:PIN domain-containing protein [Anaerolineae bacterium]
MAQRVKAVLDTSALLSAERRALLYFAQQRLYTIVISNYIVWELSRKMVELGWRTDTARRYIDALSDLAVWCDYRQIIGSSYEEWLKDPDDHPIMATALAGRAEYIVTWNVRDFPPKKRFAGFITIVTPEVFLQRLASKIKQR